MEGPGQLPPLPPLIWPCLGVSHFAFGRSDYDFNEGLVLDRGHGGTAIYWSENLKASSFSNCDGSIISLRIFF